MAYAPTIDAAHGGAAFDNSTQFDASVRLYKQLVDHQTISIAQTVLKSLMPWEQNGAENDRLIAQLEGKEVPKEVYAAIDAYGGIVPPPDAVYACIFFTFTLEHVPAVKGARRRLFIRNVRTGQ